VEKVEVETELRQVRSQLNGFVEAVRAAFSAADGVSNVLARATEISEVAEPLLEVLCESLEFDVATFWRFDLADGKLYPVAHHQSPCCGGQHLGEVIGSLRMALNESAAGRVFVERRAFTGSDAVAVAHPKVAPILEGSGLRTICAFPIIGSNAPLGVIELERRQPLGHDHTIEPAVRMIGERIAAFIEYGELRGRYLALAARQESTAERHTEEPGKVIRLRRAA